MNQKKVFSVLLIFIMLFSMNMAQLFAETDTSSDSGDGGLLQSAVAPVPVTVSVDDYTITINEGGSFSFNADPLIHTTGKIKKIYVDHDRAGVTYVTPTKGTANESSHVVSYQANSEEYGSDTFNYLVEVIGKNGTSAIAYGNVFVEINAIPVAWDDEISINTNQSININALENDEDFYLGTLDITSITAATLGTAVLNDDNTITYTAGNTEGVDEFEYTVTDGEGGQATGIVYVYIREPEVITLVKPVFEYWCRDLNNEEKYIAFFGYDNKSTTDGASMAVTVPKSNSNKLTPNNYEEEFPITEFAPGRQRAVMALDNWDGSTIVWSLLGRTATASKGNVGQYLPLLTINKDVGGTVTNVDRLITNRNEEVDVTAPSVSGYTFTGWFEGEELISDAPNITYEMGAVDATIVAKYVAISTPPSPPSPPSTPMVYYNLDITVEGPGSVLPNSGTFNSDTIVMLYTQANPGAHFVGWFGANGSEVSNSQIYINGNKSIVARFEVDVVEVEDEETPQSGNVTTEEDGTDSTDSSNQGQTDEIVLDETVPQDAPKLPQTGGIPLALVMGAGFVITAGGFKLRRKEEKK